MTTFGVPVVDSDVNVRCELMIICRSVSLANEQELKKSHITRVLAGARITHQVFVFTSLGQACR